MIDGRYALMVAPPDDLTTKVGIAMVAGDMMHTRTAQDLCAMRLRMAMNGIDHAYTQEGGTVLATARNKAVKGLLEEGCSHVLFVDSDMRFPAYTVERMLQWDKPVIAANCAKRRRPTGPTARVKNDSIGGESVTLFPDPEQHDLAKVESVGTGLMLIKADVFLTIKYPWFATPWVERDQEHMGEDIHFCYRCWEADIPIYVDQGLSWHVRHIGVHEFSMADTLAEMEAIKQAGGWGEYTARIPA